MKSIVSILIAILMSSLGLSGQELSESNLSHYVAPDCASTAKFICENFDKFVYFYNSDISEETEKIKATHCEFSLPVYITTFDSNGIYLDFNDENGYMIVADNYEIVAMQTIGDLEYLKSLDYAYFSVYDGFLQKDTCGNLIPFERKTFTEEDWEDYTSLLLSKSYDGQYSGRDGEIYNPDAFVKDKYGKGYSLYTQNHLHDYEYVSQSSLTVYWTIKNSLYYGEGNCSLSSIYSLLNYLKQKNVCPKFPSSTQTISHFTSNDSFYNKYKNNPKYSVEKYVNLPQLYSTIRSIAIKDYDYEIDGTNPFHIDNIIKKVGTQYGHKLSTSHIIFWSYESQVVNEINAGYPTIWNMANSSTYGSHSTVVTGYKTYRKTKKILGLKIHSYVKLLALNDNWSEDVRYFDFTHYYAFGSFVKVRVQK